MANMKDLFKCLNQVDPIPQSVLLLLPLPLQLQSNGANFYEKDSIIWKNAFKSLILQFEQNGSIYI